MFNFTTNKRTHKQDFLPTRFIKCGNTTADRVRKQDCSSLRQIANWYTDTQFGNIY